MSAREFCAACGGGILRLRRGADAPPSGGEDAPPSGAGCFHRVLRRLDRRTTQAELAITLRRVRRGDLHFSAARKVERKDRPRVPLGNPPAKGRSPSFMTLSKGASAGGPKSPHRSVEPARGPQCGPCPRPTHRKVSGYPLPASRLPVGRTGCLRRNRTPPPTPSPGRGFFVVQSQTSGGSSRCGARCAGPGAKAPHQKSADRFAVRTFYDQLLVYKFLNSCSRSRRGSRMVAFP